MNPSYIPYLMAIVGSVICLLIDRPRTPLPVGTIDSTAWLRHRIGELCLWIAAAGFFAIAFEHLTLR
jgi:hypothetical protein